MATRNTNNNENSYNKIESIVLERVFSLEQLRLEIQREMIQKWNGSFPTTMLGDDPTMLFNLNK